MLDLTPKSLKRRDKETPINKREYLQPNNSRNEDHTKRRKNAEKSGGQSPQEINLVRTKRENN